MFPLSDEDTFVELSVNFDVEALRQVVFHLASRQTVQDAFLTVPYEMVLSKLDEMVRSQLRFTIAEMTSNNNIKRLRQHSYFSTGFNTYGTAWLLYLEKVTMYDSTSEKKLNIQAFGRCVIDFSERHTPKHLETFRDVYFTKLS